MKCVKMTIYLMMFRCGLVLVVTAVCAVHAIEVDIPGLGKVEGLTTQAVWTKSNIHQFRGIPYAKTTSGDRRFKEPIKADKWTGVLNGTIFRQPCPQPSLSSNIRVFGMEEWSRDTVQTFAATTDPEDCLALNVYTPNITLKMPVLVYFHGGGFIVGSSAYYDPGFLLEKDIVLVTPQYRLGVFGFFQLDTVDAPGNVALLDQITALQWVKDNIAAFGGDPTRVTIAGSSAGGASVSLHMVNPKSRGLFHKVIGMSGSALASWAVDESEGVKHSLNVSRIAGCSDPNAAATCMRQLTIDQINAATLLYSASERKEGRLGMGSYVPTLQKPNAQLPTMITEDPLQVLESGKYDPVPLMMGVTRHEGIFFLDLSYQFFLEPNKLTNNETFMKEEFIPTLLNLYGVSDPSRVITKTVLEHYFDSKDIGNFTRMTPGLVDFCGTLLMKAASERQAWLNCGRHNRTYLYSFDYYGNQTLLSSSKTTVPVPGGITHGDDTLYLFPRSKKPLNTEDTKTAKRMVEFFTNFVRFSDPTPDKGVIPGVPAKWPPYTSEKGEYLSIGNRVLVKKNFVDSFIIAETEGMTYKSSSVITSRGTGMLLVFAALLYTLF